MDKKKILLVEDDKDTRGLYKEILEQNGYEVTIAVDGQEGLDKAKAGGFNLILLDIMMPILDGLAVLTQLKQAPPATPNGPIIALTNLAQDNTIRQAMELGAAGYLIKSNLNPGEVVQEIKMFLK